jgi:hypothetical protein
MAEGAEQSNRACALTGERPLCTPPQQHRGRAPITPVLVLFLKNWRRVQDSNLQGVSPGGFQVHCLTN